jgi:hypothetical protein
MVIDHFPNHKLEDVIKKFMRQEKLPPIIKKWETYATPDGEKGIKSYNLIKVERGNADEAYLEIAKIFTKLCVPVEGRYWEIEPLLGVQDMMKSFSGSFKE